MIWKLLLRSSAGIGRWTSRFQSNGRLRLLWNSTVTTKILPPLDDDAFYRTRTANCVPIIASRFHFSGSSGILFFWLQVSQFYSYRYLMCKTMALTAYRVCHVCIDLGLPRRKTYSSQIELICKSKIFTSLKRSSIGPIPSWHSLLNAYSNSSAECAYRRAAVESMSTAICPSVSYVHGQL